MMPGDTVRPRLRATEQSPVVLSHISHCHHLKPVPEARASAAVGRFCRRHNELICQLTHDRRVFLPGNNDGRGRKTSLGFSDLTLSLHCWQLESSCLNLSN